MEKDKTNIIDRLEAWAAKDWWVILVAIFCLLACMYTINSVSKYQDQINNAWVEMWDNSGCASKYSEPNITFNWRGEYENTYRDKDTEGPGEIYRR